MTIYAWFFISIALLLITLLSCFIFLQRKNAPVRLYVEALKNENSGFLEAALITYETALEEVKKIRFHKQLENKIIEKLRLLHTIIEYKKGLVFTR